MITLQHTNTRPEGFFSAMLEDKKAGEIVYKWSSENTIIILHTEVNPVFKGKNIGKDLVMAVIDYARQNNLKIIPVCEFAKSLFNKHPELHDVLK